MKLIDIYYCMPWYLQNLTISIYGQKLKYKRFGEEYLSALDFIKSSSDWDEDRIFSYKEEKLYQIIEHAYRHCPYYHEKYKKAGLEPKDFKSLQDINKFPILTKEEVCTNAAGMIADNISRKGVEIGHTSGSTGKALKVFHSSINTAYYWAAIENYHQRFGFYRNEPYLELACRPLVSIKAKKSPYWRYDKALGRYYLPMQQINKTKISDIVRWIDNKSFKTWIGYPSIITNLCNEIIETAETIQNHPKHIFLSAEKLYGWQRNIIDEVFPHSELHEFYGYSEQVVTASHCQESCYHEDFQLGHIEIVDEDYQYTKGIGHILATGFTNEYMPFIRYLNGDSAVMSSSYCKCGLKSQRLEEISGRSEDYIVTPEGLHVHRFASIFKDAYAIKECQVVQKEPNSIIIKIVKRDSYNLKDETQIRDNIRLMISPTLNIRFEYVDEIPRNKNGKFQAVLSMM